MQAITPNVLQRDMILSRLEKEYYDLIIIGGGITGAGIALDAASRGLKTALLEKNDFASGTSSRSTKLIHGGLRYLKQFEIALVREVGRERNIVHHLAPHLVRSEKMLLPLIKGGTYGRLTTSFGLMIYDVLAGVESQDQRKMLSREETLEREPLLDAQRVEGAGLYAEYRTDDARLTIEVIKTASGLGADCLNYCEVLGLTYKEKMVQGVEVRDGISGKSHTYNADVIVNAAGPWVDELREKDHSLEGKHLHLTKGVHIVLPHNRLPVHQAVYFDVEDGRMIFAIPRGRITYVGTTDTEYSGSKNKVLADKSDVLYLINAVNNMFPDQKLEISDVVSSWAGLRPLIHEEGKSASELSRKDELFESPAGLLSIAGGKLTGYRKMAERVVDAVVKKMHDLDEERHFSKIQTETISLGGYTFESPAEVKGFEKHVAARLGATRAARYLAWYLVSTYGKQTDLILSLLDTETDNEDLLIEAECRYTMKYELVMNLSDFFVRRTGRLYFDIESVRKYSGKIARLMQDHFHWSDAEKQQQLTWMKEQVKEVSHFH